MTSLAAPGAFDFGGGQGTSGRLLVTGANGLVGSRLVARLAAAGERVVAVGRGERRFGALATEGGRGAPGSESRSGSDIGYIEYVELDLAQPASLRALIETVRPSAVLHAAAMTDVDACEADPRGAWMINVRTVEAAALGCSSVGARLIALSTDYVFDGANGPYSEDDVPNPRGVYARTKRMGEEAALVLAPDCAVARVAVVYSGRPGAKRTFAVGVAESLLAGKPVKAFHDQIVSPTLADNAAELVIAVLGSGERGIFHCAGATALSRVEFCRALARKLGADERLVVPVALADLKLPAPRPLRCGLRVDKIRRLGGAPLEIDAALDRFLAERPQAPVVERGQ
jgi:dTDP-4-dehydrorhamnose reductase